MKNPTLRRLSRLLLCLLLLGVSSFPAWAVTRAELLGRVLETLRVSQIPSGGLPPDVPPDHPFAGSLRTAVATGRIPGGLPFDPDRPPSREEALDLALRGLGLGVERDLLARLRAPASGDASLPAPTVTETLDPPLPGELGQASADPLGDEQVPKLLDWVALCPGRLVWEARTSEVGAELLLHREGVGGAPEEGFVLQIDATSLEDGGAAVTAAAESLGLHPQVVPTPTGPVVQIGPFPTSQAALDVAAQHPEWPQANCVTLQAQVSPALFYAAARVDMGRYALRVPFAEASGGFGRLPLSQFAERSDPRPLVVMNGGFFAGNRPIGSLVLEGLPGGKAYGGRSALGWTERGDLFFGDGTSRVAIQASGTRLEVTRFNTPPDAHGLALYIPQICPQPKGLGDALLLRVEGGVVTAAGGSDTVPTALSGTTFLVAARGRSRAFLERLQPGDPVEIRTEWAFPAFEGCSGVLQAGPLLLEGGRDHRNPEGFARTLTDRRHPRTVVGIDGSALVFLVVDGRSTLHSRGTTLEETRALARRLGLLTALNLDGGGSTQLIWKGVTVNRPSDGRERPLPYALLAVPR